MLLPMGGGGRSGDKYILGRGNSVSKILEKWKRTKGLWGRGQWKRFVLWGQGESSEF